MRSRSRPQRPRTGSHAVRSAGTGQKRSTKCRRGGPVAAQRSSGLPRRQGGSPFGADGRGCQAAGGAERSPAPTDDGFHEGGRGRKVRQAVHKAGRERRRGATPATATPAAYLADQWNEEAATDNQERTWLTSGGFPGDEEAQTKRESHGLAAWKEKRRARISKGGAGPGAGKENTALARVRKERCRRRDRAGAEECPGAAPASA